MRTWFWASVLTATVAIGTVPARGQEAKQLAQQGYSVFMLVLGGDEARYPDAVKLLEQARDLDPSNADNLYNLGRLYFYDALTKNNGESALKAEQTLAQLMELKPDDTRALSFHGSILTSLSNGGKDLGKFMLGVREMNTAVERAPREINNRIVRAFTSRNFPSQALAAMGNYDALSDLELVRDVFNDNTFSRAPHADVVMKAFVGDAYKSRGDDAKAKANFAAALAVPRSGGQGTRAGRDLLDAAIQARMDGGDKPLGSGAFAGCHSCHWNAPDKILK